MVITYGCSDTKKPETEGQSSIRSAQPVERAPQSGRITGPDDGEIFTVGDQVNILVSLDEDAPEVLSVKMTVSGEEVNFSGDVPGNLVWNSEGHAVGRRVVRVIVDFADQRTDTYTVEVVFRSDIVPDRYGYRVINSHPHDIRAFTQGLVYHEGYLYESTGQYGQSTLRKVVPETGEILRSVSLDRDLFGEGLCVHDGKLYQLTWKSRVGFIYDIESFRLLRRIYYQSEGWGLTSDGTNLLKSDGSHYIYVLEPMHFAEIDRFEVFDHNGRMEGLNEMEYIDGTIYANVFGTDEIVMIDHLTGRVTGVIDLTGLLDRRYHHPALDVLNGIAYDSENDRLFVTGKNWPRLFEIELVPR